MDLCESCNAIASMMDTRALVFGEVAGCGLCRTERNAPEEEREEQPSHPDLPAIVYAYDPDGLRREQLSAMTAVRSEDSGLFKAEELRAARARSSAPPAHAERTLLLDEDSSAYSLQSIAAATAAQTASPPPAAEVEVDEFVHLGSGIEERVASITAPASMVALAPADPNQRPWFRSSLSGEVGGIVVVLGLVGLWMFAITYSLVSDYGWQRSEQVSQVSTTLPPLSVASLSPFVAEPEPEEPASSGVIEFPSILIEGRLPVVRAPSAELPAATAPAAAVAPEPAARPSPAAAPEAAEARGAAEPTSSRRSLFDRAIDEERAPSATDELLNDVLGPHRPDSTQLERAVDPTLPAQLNRAQVVTGMRSVARLARNCGVDTGRTVVVNATISGATGRVSNVSISDAIAGTPEGGCVVRAVERAQFPLFNDRVMRVTNFPLVVR